MIPAGQELANWWDRAYRRGLSVIDRRVRDAARNGEPDYFAITLATTAETSGALGAGFVDLLRLGEGVSKGGWGYVDDGLRLLTVAGPGVRLGQLGLKRFLKVDSAPTLNICTWVAGVQALRQTGVKHFATVADLVKANKSSRAVEWIHPSYFLAGLRNLGAKADVEQVANLDGLRKLAAKHPGSPCIFVMRFMKNGEETGHTMLAFRDDLGRFKILDRTGDIVDDLIDLERKHPQYAGIAKGYLFPDVVRVHRASVLRYAPGVAARQANLFSFLAFEVRSVALRSRERMDALLAAGTGDAGAGKIFGPLNVNVRAHVVQPGENLSKIAKKYYGNPAKWRFLYEVNRDAIGRNPDLVRTGTSLAVP